MSKKFLAICVLKLTLPRVTMQVELLYKSLLVKKAGKYLRFKLTALFFTDFLTVSFNHVFLVSLKALVIIIIYLRKLTETLY